MLKKFIVTAVLCLLSSISVAGYRYWSFNNARVAYIHDFINNESDLNPDDIMGIEYTTMWWDELGEMRETAIVEFPEEYFMIILNYNEDGSLAKFAEVQEIVNGI